MSVGNLNTQGDKKNNWTWQNAVLQLLGQIAAGGGGGGGCPCPSNAQEATLQQLLTNTPAAVVRNLVLVRSSVAGNVPSGARSVTVANTGAANGLVLGTTIKPGESFTWSAGQNDTLAAISYDGTGTELVITTVV